MNSKYFISIIFLFLFFLKGFSQNELLEHNHSDDIICKFHKTGNTNPSKSVINYNPRVFQYDVKFYKLDLEAYDSINLFSGNAIIKAQVLISQLDTFTIELSNKLIVDSVLINGINHSYTHSEDIIDVVLQSPLQLNDLFVFQLYYHTPVDYSSIYYSSTQVSSYDNFKVSQTFSEPYFAHEWMPCKQELEDKADSVHIFITTDDDLKVAGPGILTEVMLPDNKVRHEWRTNYPTAFYLIAFAISDYQEYKIYAKPDSLPGDSILVLNYLYDYPGVLESYKSTIDYTPAMIELFSDIMGLYPFYEEKYGHYMWYPSNFSGMEHITMSGMRYFSFDLVAHELGHSWYGDNVTCATWSDIWVNEGFATYAQYLARQYILSQASANSLMVSYQNYAMSSPAGSVYVPEDDLGSWSRIFSGRLTYRKGGALVHMIRFEMNNDSLFFKTLYEFQQKFKDSIATGIDFRNTCLEISGIDFTDFFSQWYFGEGYPIFNLYWWQLDDTLYLNNLQQTSTAVTQLFKTPIEFKLSWDGNDTTIRLFQESNDTTFAIPFNEEITNIEIDPNNWLLNKVGSINHRQFLDIQVLLEGPFNPASQKMETLLYPDLLPDFQPYTFLPWNYSGTENINQLSNENVVDWVLISLYDTTDASLISEEVLVNQQAVLLLDNGSLVETDGISNPIFYKNIQNGLFIKIEHRNHLAILSANSLSRYQSIYSLDFSAASSLVIGEDSGYKLIDIDKWGMISGDANSDGTIGLSDISEYWSTDAGTKGYFNADLNLDGQIENTDKDDYWLPNLGKSTSVNETK